MSEKSGGGCIDYMAGSPYAVATYYIVDNKKTMAEISTTLNIVLFKMQQNYEYRGVRNGQQVSVILDNECFAAGYPNFKTIMKIPYVKGLRQKDVIASIQRCDTMDMMVMMHLNRLGVVGDKDAGALDAETDYLQAILDKEYKKQDLAYMDCYKGLEGLIDLWLLKGKVYAKSLREILKKNNWVMKRYLKDCRLDSDFIINAGNGLEISGCGQAQNITSALMEQTTKSGYKFKYWTDDNPYLVAWIVNKINRRSTKGIEQRIMKELTPNRLFTLSSEIVEDIWGYLENEFNMKINFLIIFLVNYDHEGMDAQSNKICVGYKDINRKVKSGKLLKIDRKKMEEWLKDLAKMRLMGKSKITVHLDITKNLELEDFRIIEEKTVS